MPHLLRILGKDWTVSWVDSPMSGQMGECRSDRLELVVSLSLVPDQQRDTLLHEVIHAISETVKLNLTEEQVHALGGLLFAVFRDNPEFVDFLVE